MTEPNYTPKSKLTLSAGPKVLQVPSGPLTALRSERDPLTPALIGELVTEHHPLHLSSLGPELDRICESELRALWGDR